MDLAVLGADTATKSTAATRDRIAAQSVLPTLEDVWPEVSAWLHARLRARLTSVDDRNDVIQEVAVRVLATGVPFTSAEDLRPWCLTVARRIAIDLHRSGRHRAHGGDLPQIVDVVDPARQVVGRASLRALAELLAGLPANDQELLLAHRGRAPAWTNADHVRRHRLRSRLAAALVAAGYDEDPS